MDPFILRRVVFVLAIFSTLCLVTKGADIYKTYHYAVERIFYHNDVIWTPDGPSGYVQCADACSKSGVDLCTAFTVANNSRCVFYGGCLDSPGTPIAGGGLDVNRLVTVTTCNGNNRRCSTFSRMKVGRYVAGGICSNLGGSEPQLTSTVAIDMNADKYRVLLGCYVDYWAAAIRHSHSSSTFYWVPSGLFIGSAFWATGEPDVAAGGNDPCVYLAKEGKLKVAPCTDQYAFRCMGFPMDNIMV